MKRLGTVCMLLLCFILIGITACSSDDKETTSQQLTNSDTNVTITADGNIEALFHEKLTFGSGGRVAQVAVKEGDMVSEDDVLATLETDALELAFSKAKVAQAEAQVAVSLAEIAVNQARVALQTAEYNLNQTQSSYTLNDIKAAESDVAVAQNDLEEALWILTKYDEGTVGWQEYQRVVIFAQTRVNNAEDRLDAILTGGDSEQVAIKKLQVEIAKQSLEATKQSLEATKQSLELAEQSVGQAQKQLDEATIIAPFDGVVAKVRAKEGEYLLPTSYTGTTIVELIDPRYMELTARVDELDVVKVKTGQKVIISVDAMPETKFEGLVTFISPVAREPGAVLFEDEDEEKDYEVKIDFDIPENSPICAGMGATAEIIVE